ASSAPHRSSNRDLEQIRGSFRNTGPGARALTGASRAGPGEAHLSARTMRVLSCEDCANRPGVSRAYSGRVGAGLGGSCPGARDRRPTRAGVSAVRLQVELLAVRREGVRVGEGWIDAAEPFRWRSARSDHPRAENDLVAGEIAGVPSSALRRLRLEPPAEAC